MAAPRASEVPALHDARDDFAEACSPEWERLWIEEIQRNELEEPDESLGPEQEWTAVLARIQATLL